MSPLRVLVVDDDPLSRERIRSLLQDDAELEVIGECGDGRAGVEAIRREQPDLLFLDVQMPELDGFGVVEAIGAERMPVVVFVSAYVEFALRAFDAYALDYLLKPFAADRFALALARAKEQARLRAPGQDARISALARHLAGDPAAYPEVLAIKAGGQYAFVRVEEVDWVEADGNYARLHLGAATRMMTRTVTELETRILDPARFARIHRSTIVNLSRIVAAEPLFHGDLSVSLRDGTRLTCSRRYRHNLEARVFFTS